ncbi:MAG: FAD-dependent monooxygenase [Pseudomonadota bacterium]|nr:FAD-dependent monooxygenase [Pseudomonadota bacterium]
MSKKVIIIGTGMAGLCLANLLLKQTDFEIILVGALDPTKNKNHARVCAFNKTSLSILKFIGFDNEFLNNNCSFYKDVYIWQNKSNSELNFNADDLGFINLGGVIANHKVEEKLWRQLQNNKKVKIYCPVNAKGWEYKKDLHHVILDDNTIIKGDLLFGADGKNSWVRQQVGISTENSPYDQLAIVAKVCGTSSHSQTAWQKFLPTGPLAFLPLNDANEVSIVWSATTPYAEKLMQLDDHEFEKTLTTNSDHKLGDLRLTTSRYAYKLEAQHAKKYIKRGVAILGDAAHIAHPLAGQGVNAGLFDAAILVDEISKVVAEKNDLQLALVRYQKLRRGHNSCLIFAMGQLNNFFANTNPIISTSRYVGLNMINKSNIAKSFLAKHALGLNNNLPHDIKKSLDKRFY